LESKTASEYLVRRVPGLAIRRFPNPVVSFFNFDAAGAYSVAARRKGRGPVAALT
jgi:hypothetical protein